MQIKYSCHTLVLICALAFSLVPGAALTPMVAVDPRVAELEEKLFMHPYKEESVDARIERLEHMVFGQSMSGSQEERISRLIAAVRPSDVTAGAGNRTAARSGSEAPPASAKREPDDAKWNNNNNENDTAPGGTAADEEQPSAEPSSPPVRSFDSGKPADNRVESMPPAAPVAPGRSPGRSSGMSSSGNGNQESMPRVAPDFSSYSQREIPVAPPYLVLGSRAETGAAPPVAPPIAPRRSYREQPNFSPAVASKPDRISSAAGSDDAVPLRPAIGTDEQRPASPDTVAPLRPRINPQQTGGNPVASGGSEGAAPAQGLRQRIGVLELQVFGMTFEKKSFPDRLAHLETAIFPGSQPLENLPVTQRVERLYNDPSVKARAARTNSGLPPR